MKRIRIYNVSHVTCAGVFIKASGADGARKNQKVI